MALTTGAQAASATAAADQYTLIAAALTAAGWQDIHSGTPVSASDAGTTDIVYVWASPATVESPATVWTGCILYFEVDNTNTRIRVRASEIYDEDVAGTPALRVKFPVAGVAGALVAVTPTSSAAVIDSFISIVSGNTGYIELNQNASGFDYWLGANANTFVYFSNSGSLINQCIAGHLQYAGDKNTAQGSLAVFIVGNAKTTTTGTTSWAMSMGTSGGSWSTARTSREPGSASVSTVVAFAYGIAGPTGTSTFWSPANSGGPGVPGFPSKFFTHTVMYPAWLHGAAGGAGTAWGNTAGAMRSNLAPLAEFIVSFADSSAQAPEAQKHLTIGDTVTGSDGETYTAMGVNTGTQFTTNNGLGGAHSGLHVRNSDF